MVPLMTKSIMIQYMSSSWETYLSPVHTFQRAPWAAVKKFLGLFGTQITTTSIVWPSVDLSPPVFLGNQSTAFCPSQGSSAKPPLARYSALW